MVEKLAFNLLFNLRAEKYNFINGNDFSLSKDNKWSVKENISKEMHISSEPNFPYSRAWLTAETWEGKIFTPIYFHRVKTGGMDRSKGCLRGSKHTGKVSLKSRSGSIKVYQSVN